VVTDTDHHRSGRHARNRATMVDLPTPEGPTMT
jgi:hypothetical protein